MGYKGFQSVEAKPNKRDKTKQRSEEHEAEFSPTAAAYRASPQAQTKTEVEKSKRLPGENPIDPRAVKADLKAARALQKVYASQTHTAASGPVASAPSRPATASNNNGASSAGKQQKVETVNMGAWGSVAKPAVQQQPAAAQAKPASVSIPHHTSGGSWGSKSAASVRGAGVLHEAANFTDLPSSGPDPVEDRRHYGGPKQPKQEDTLANWTAAKKKQPTGNNKAAAAAAPQTHVAATLVVGKKATAKHVDAPVAAATATDEILAGPDGSALPISVAAVVLTADGKSKEIALSGTADKMPVKCEQYTGGLPKNATAIANLHFRGGLFITVAGKKFSDATTVNEPRMCECYFKALGDLITAEPAEAAEGVVIQPFLQHGTGASTDSATPSPAADVRMRIIRANPKDSLNAPTTLIELEHLTDMAASGSKAQARKVRASFKSFVSGMMRAGEQLVVFREALEDVLEAGPLKGAAGAEVTKAFAGKFNSTLAALKKAYEATA